MSQCFVRKEQKKLDGTRCIAYVSGGVSYPFLYWGWDMKKKRWGEKYKDNRKEKL